MGVNAELNALQKEVTKQRILETGFRIFAEKSIDKVTMNDVADAAGIGVATVYRYYSNKTLLVQAVSAWAWERYVSSVIKREVVPGETAARRFSYFLDSFLDLYRHHKDILRFNQFFNIYAEHENVSQDAMKPYTDVVKVIAQRFHLIYQQALEDHTLSTDVPESEMFWTTMHLMMAVITRYAVGLAFKGPADPEEELKLQKNMLLREFTNR